MYLFILVLEMYNFKLNLFFSSFARATNKLYFSFISINIIFVIVLGSILKLVEYTVCTIMGSSSRSKQASRPP